MQAHGEKGWLIMLEMIETLRIERIMDMCIVIRDFEACLDDKERRSECSNITKNRIEFERDIRSSQYIL